MIRHALILDDDPLVLSLLQGFLGRRGYEVSTFSNPSTCPLYNGGPCPCPLQGGCPDVIVTDFEMPFANGVEFIERIKQKHCKCLNILLISGYSTNPLDLRRALEHGVTFLAKPFHLDQLHFWLDKVESLGGSVLQPSFAVAV